MTGDVDGNALTIHAIDAGLGISGARDSQGLGLGIPLIAALTDDVSFEPLSEGGTDVRMTFVIRPRRGGRAKGAAAGTYPSQPPVPGV